jgi:hypothetical protein
VSLWSADEFPRQRRYQAHRPIARRGCACKLPLSKLDVLHDVQTSSGLLLAIPPDCTDLLGDLTDRGVPAAVVGRVLRGIPGHIRILNKEE